VRNIHLQRIEEYNRKIEHYRKLNDEEEAKKEQLVSRPKNLLSEDDLAFIVCYCGAFQMNSSVYRQP